MPQGWLNAGRHEAFCRAMRTFSAPNPQMPANESEAGQASARPERPLPAPALPILELRRRRHTLVSVCIALVLCFFWVGVGGAYLWGVQRAHGLVQVPFETSVLIAAALA